MFTDPTVKYVMRGESGTGPNVIVEHEGGGITLKLPHSA